jgi:hypothetical protein
MHTAKMTGSKRVKLNCARLAGCALLAISLAFLSPQVAVADSINCTVRGAALDRQDRWIAPSYEFAFDPETYQASVLDEVSADHAGRAMNVDSNASSDKKLVFVWEVPVRHRDGHVAVITYRAVMFRRDMSFIMRANSSVYWIKDSEGRGACVFGKQKNRTVIW